jgi:hypothetical protein
MKDDNAKRQDHDNEGSQPPPPQTSNLWFVDDENHLHTMWNLDRIFDPRD